MKQKNNDAAIVMAALEKESAPTIKKVSNLVIESNEDFELAGQLMKLLKQKATQAREREESLTNPLKSVLADIRTLFKPFRDNIDILEFDTKRKMLAFSTQQSAQAKKLEADFASGKIKKVSTLLSKQNELEVSSAFSGVRKTWTAVCVDADKTPRAYMVPDEVAIKAALKAGKKVAGWEWKQIESIAI